MTEIERISTQARASNSISMGPYSSVTRHVPVPK